jgi:2,5-diamino-6-(ribosylamino)-4(3H)-pyrimidinone 5'-phosphate reductase
MMSSVDGRTLTAHWGNLKGKSSYEETGSTHEAQAWMCGRITMETDFASNKPLHLNNFTGITERVDYIADKNATSFAIAVDKDGKLHWEEPAIDQDHIISVLSESVSDNYLGYLQNLGISYIFGEKKK